MKFEISKSEIVRSLHIRLEFKMENSILRYLINEITKIFAPLREFNSFPKESDVIKAII